MSDSSPEFPADLGELFEYDEIEYFDAFESTESQSYQNESQKETKATDGIPLNVELLESMCQNSGESTSALAISTNPARSPLQNPKSFVKAPEIFLRIDNSDLDATNPSKSAQPENDSRTMPLNRPSSMKLLCDNKCDSFESNEGSDKQNNDNDDCQFTNELQYENEFFDPKFDDVGNNFSYEIDALHQSTSENDNEQLLLEGILILNVCFFVVYRH